MDADTLKKAVSLAKMIGHAFIATADATGLPHIAAARKIALNKEGIVVEEWFCPGTLANLAENRRMAIVVWDPDNDLGYQLLGEAIEVEDTAIMDGYAPDIKNDKLLPQVERRLLVRVDKVIHFSSAPHTDQEGR